MSSGGGQGGQGGGAQQQQQQRRYALERQRAAAQQLNDPVLQGIAGAPDFNRQLRTAVLGRAVDRTEYVADDLRGKNMGLGTFQNAGQNLFSTKESVLMVPEWADRLNDLLGQEVERANVAARQGIADFSAGIYGVLPGQEGAALSADYYVPSITQYYPDDRGRISILAIGDDTEELPAGIPSVLLPGSTASRLALDRGYAVGLAYVKNPGNRTGYLRVGSPGWRNALQRWARESFGGNRWDFHHLFGQGAVYGLGPVYYLFNIDVIPEQAQEGLPVRYRLQDTAQLGQLLQNGTLMRSIQSYYDTYLRNPDQSRIGQYGAAALLLRHSDKMNTTATGGAGNYTPEQRRTFNTAVARQFAENGSVAGLAHWGRGGDGVNYADFSQRRGLTANPLRLANGQPIRIEQSANKRAGNCNIWGSGVGVQQRASLGGEYGFRFYKQSRKHLSRKKGEEGTEIAKPTFFCGPTPDYVINPDRQVYQQNQARTAPGTNLADLIDRYGNGYSSDDLRAQYLNWALNPQAYGTNPYFMLNPNEGRLGFSKAAPLFYQQNMTPEQAQAFQGLDLTRAQKVGRSRQLLDRLDEGVPPTIGKQSYPTGGFGQQARAQRGAERNTFVRPPGPAQQGGARATR